MTIDEIEQAKHSFDKLCEQADNWAQVADLVTKLDQETRPNVDRMGDDDILQIVLRCVREKAYRTKVNKSDGLLTDSVDVRTHGLVKQLEKKVGELGERISVVADYANRRLDEEAIARSAQDANTNNRVVALADDEHRHYHEILRRIEALESKR